jgi:non-ribosomal peptide synthetase component F
VNHSNVVRLFTATGSKFHHKHDIELFHSIAFDFSVWEIETSLMATLVVVPWQSFGVM